MPSKIIFERFLWFHNRVKAGLYPNARVLAEKFEVCRKTAQRDIEFIRDRLNAPLVYVSDRRGYEYEDKTYELPGLWINEDELGALLIASRLASTIPDRSLKSSLKAFLQQIVTIHSIKSPFTLDELGEKISVKNIEYARVDETIFQMVVDALFLQKALEIDYFSPHKDEDSRRVIFPLHLLQYMGSWHVIAHCTLRGELRDFALSRIRRLTPFQYSLPPRIATGSVKDFIRKNFGILSSDASITVCLKFATEVAAWISEQIWHADQVQDIRPDGSLCLTFPAADLREVKREVLRFGSQVEVLAPLDLRNEVKNEIRKMAGVYGEENNSKPDKPGRRQGAIRETS
ncbi:MAG: WYL domain-containing protein [Desulfobacterales bacterium]|nr:WYL domain-containing protein [Desulfobacterales bacterium]